MKKFGVSAAAIVLGAIISMPASAADYSPPPIFRAPPQPFVEIGSNWYIRGDFGYRFSGETTASVGPVNVTTDGFNDTASLSGGFGYRFNNWLRADLTGDYAFGARFADFGVLGDRPKMWSSAAFANAYIDLGSWFGASPYVGAGVGGAYNTIQDSTLGPNEGRWNFAWAGMVGFGYALSPNLIADISYRYVDLGEARAGPLRIDDITAHEFRIGFRYLID